MFFFSLHEKTTTLDTDTEKYHFLKFQKYILFTQEGNGEIWSGGKSANHKASMIWTTLLSS